MTIASELTKLQNNLSDSYTAVQNKGGTLPQTLCFDNLPTAIGTITQTNLTILSVTQNGTYTPSSPYNGYSQVEVNVQSGLLESILQNIVDGNNPVDITTLQSAETQINAFLGSSS